MIGPGWQDFLKSFLNVYNEKINVNLGGHDPRAKKVVDEEEAPTNTNLDLTVFIIVFISRMTLIEFHGEILEIFHQHDSPTGPRGVKTPSTLY